MLTVGNDADEVERRLVAGRLGCPGCGQRLAPWGHARARVVRGPHQARWRWRPRRARCAGCRGTHVLLPVARLVRRADMAVVIGAALAAKASGMGHRPIAQQLGRPAATVRGWLRRFAARAEGLREATAKTAASRKLSGRLSKGEKAPPQADGRGRRRVRPDPCPAHDG